jgi:HD superfamily phosphohydrolase
MQEIWAGMTPPLRADDIVKLAVGPKYAEPLVLSTWELVLSTWETVLAEIITGDAFGADRMDYLLRDAYHAGVS